MSTKSYMLSEATANALQRLIEEDKHERLNGVISSPSRSPAQRQVAIVKCGVRVGSSSPYWNGVVTVRNGDGTYSDTAQAVYITSANSVGLLRENARYLAVRLANDASGAAVFVTGDTTNATYFEVGEDRTNGPLLALYGDQISMHRVESGKTHTSFLLENTDGQLMLQHTVVDGSLVDTAILQFFCRIIELIGTVKLIGNVEINGTPGADGTDGLGSVFEEGICTTVGTGTGPAGADGADGADGAPGSVWRNGTGAPSSGLGIDGDYYLDGDTGNVYLKASGSYSIVANIKGATGATGATGSTGATGATGAGVPTGGTTGQALRKIDATNYNTEWFTLPAATAAATQANMESEATGVYVDPSLVRLSPSAVKFWVTFGYRSGSLSILASSHVSTVSRTSTGKYVITPSTAFSSADWCEGFACQYDNAGGYNIGINTITKTASALTILCFYPYTNVAYDCYNVTVWGWGDV